MTQFIIESFTFFGLHIKLAKERNKTDVILLR